MKKMWPMSRELISGIRAKCIETYRNSNFLLLQGQFGKHPYQNLIALAVHRNPPQFTPEEQAALKACDESARVIVSQDHLPIIRQYFEDQKKTNSNLGKLYRTMTFGDFLLRLIQKRYKCVYLNGRLVVPRSKSDVLAQALLKNKITNFISLNPNFRYRQLLSTIGTPADRNQIFKEYLSLNELIFTPLLIPQGISIVIGTGSRHISWPYVEEAKNCTDIVILSSPVAPEFDDGITLHLDFLFSVVINDPNPNTQSRINSIKEDIPLINAARAIYGNKLAIDFTVEQAKQNQENDFIKIVVWGTEMWLYKPAYFSRLKPLISTLLLSSDEAMQRANAGTVFNLKGMGLGAFGFSEPDNQVIMEKLYIEAVNEVLKEISPKFNHIRVVNLINLPSDFNNKDRWGNTHHISTFGNVELTRSVMAPTEKTLPKRDDIVGATHFCGDSGSLVGNEAQIGAPRTSSDEPAGVYSQLNPRQLDSSNNPTLQSVDCISVLDLHTNQLTSFKNSVFAENCETASYKTSTVHKFN